jgi:glycosyltransferase involved in cell wall biosynthesis
MDVRPAMNTPQLRAFYRAVDLIVVPSHFETFSNVAAEAILLGTSVLVSEQVGFADILKAAGLKRMVIPSFEDPTLVAAAIKKIAKAKLTAKERTAVARLIDPQRVHDRLLRVLRSAEANR